MLVPDHVVVGHHRAGLAEKGKDWKASILKVKQRSAEAIVSSVTAEMDKPRVALSARAGFEAAMKN
jgi:hypothetical protein